MMTKCFGFLGELPYVNSKSSCHKNLFVKCCYRQLCKSQVRTAMFSGGSQAAFCLCPTTEDICVQNKIGFVQCLF